MRGGEYVTQAWAAGLCCLSPSEGCCTCNINGGSGWARSAGLPADRCCTCNILWGGGSPTAGNLWGCRERPGTSGVRALGCPEWRPTSWRVQVRRRGGRGRMSGRYWKHPIEPGLLPDRSGGSRLLQCLPVPPFRALQRTRRSWLRLRRIKRAGRCARRPPVPSAEQAGRVTYSNT